MRLYPDPSTNASWRVLLKTGIKTAHSANTAKASRVALISRWTNTQGLPREAVWRGAGIPPSTARG